MRKSLVFGLVLAGIQVGSALAFDQPVSSPLLDRLENLRPFQVAQARSCKAAGTCRVAVQMWCGGYRRADADSDGIPCENVCSSRLEVERIKSEIGC
jgi:hypothetical protein